MANTNRIGGAVTLFIDGVAYSARGSFEVSPSTVKREMIAGQSGVQGYTEMPVVPKIKGELTTNSSLSLTVLEQVTSSTIVIELNNGKVYTLNQACVLSDFNIATAEGKVPVEFHGMSITEL